MVIGAAAGIGGKLIGGAIVEAIRALYGIGGAVNDYIDDHIEKMKQSDNQTIARTGNVLESAKFGFGLGYISSVIIIAAGQHLLGNTLSAAGTLASAGTFTNPIAMTCAAVGAIYYGWNALSEQERNEIVANLVKGLQIGVELVRSVILFVTVKIKELLSSENISEFKTFIVTYSAKFGKSLYDVTGKMSDLVRGVAGKAAEYASIAADSTSSTVKLAGVAVGDVAFRAVDVTSDALRGARVITSEAADATTEALKEAITVTGGTASRAASATSSAFKESIDRAGNVVSDLSSSARQVFSTDKKSKSNEGRTGQSNEE